MGLDTILAIGGVIATIIVGYIGVRYTVIHKSTTELLFLKNNCISLFKSIVKNLDEIEINYKGKKVDENLILFKGTFFNNGSNDIDESIIHNPLEIELPKNYHWVDCKLIDQTKGLNVESSFNDTNLIFKWDLLKTGEYFTFDSLVEYKSDGEENKRDITKALIENLKFKHRISNLGNVKRENGIPQPMPFGSLVFISIVILGFAGLVGYLSIGQLLFPKYEVLTEVKIIPVTKRFATNLYIYRHDIQSDIKRA